MAEKIKEVCILSNVQVEGGTPVYCYKHKKDIFVNPAISDIGKGANCIACCDIEKLQIHYTVELR